MKVLLVKRLYSEGLRNQIEKNFVSICKSNNIEIEVVFLAAIQYSELRTLFPAESRNNIKIKITRHRFIGDGCIWEEI